MKPRNRGRKRGRPGPMTRAEAQAYLARWQRANEVILQLRRTTPVSVKLRQLAVLMASADLFPRQRDKQVEVARRHWQELRRAHGIDP